MLLYLDLNHWIGLSQARVGHPQGARYLGLYVALQRLTTAGTVSTPLSATHYSEIHDRIADVGQRNDLALTMAELSHYKTLVPRDVLLEAELRDSLAAEFGVAVPNGPSLLLVGHGVGFARRGQPLQGQTTGPGAATFEPSAAALIQAVHGVEAWVGGGWRFSRRDVITQGNGRERLTELFDEVTEFIFLRGPRPSEMADLRRLGYDPETLASMVIELATRERRIQAALMAKPRRLRRGDDVVAAATIVHDLLPDALPRCMRAMGISVEEFGNLDKSAMTRILLATPIVEVEMSLSSYTMQTFPRS